MTCRLKIIGDFIIEDEIGRGSFATVYKGFHKGTGQNVAVKVINTDKLNRKLLQNLDAEIAILRSCNHENVVKLLDAKKTENHIYLIMEYCSGGDFSKWLRRKRFLSEDDARFFLRQLANGLSFMHAKNLIHRDLKPQNFLLTERDKDHCCIKIADFGFAKHLSGTADLAATVCGSPLYMAPEILMHERYDAKADLWSVGVILYEMLWGKPPFRAENHIGLARKFMQKVNIKFPAYIQIIEKIKKDPSTPQSTVVPIEISSECKQLLVGLLQVNPTNRISFEDFFSHSFFKNSLSTPAVSEFLPAIHPFIQSHPIELKDDIESEHQYIQRIINDAKYAHFLMLIFEETNNIHVLHEILHFLNSTMKHAIEEKQLVSNADESMRKSNSFFNF